MLPEDGSAEAPAQDDTIVAEAPNPEPASNSEPTASNSEPNPAPSTEPKAAPESDWRQARIAKQSARIKELAAELERYKTQAAPQDTVPASELDRLANERARVLAAEQSFNARCDEVATQGQRQFPDFESKVQSLIQLRDVNDPDSVGAYRRFLEAVIETGDAPALIHRLGSAPNEAAKLMGMSPVKMAVALAKMAQAPQAQATAAPKPITPITGKGPSHEAIDPTDPERADRLSTRAWMERRNAELAKRSA